MNYHKLYVAFDDTGEPLAVSSQEEHFAYHVPERVREFVSNEVADSLADKQVNLMVKVMDLQDCIRELLKGGEHEGECEQEKGSARCPKHVKASNEREAAARKLLEESNVPRG